MARPRTSPVSPETEAQLADRLQRARRRSALGSLVISLLVIAFLMALLGFILLPALDRRQPVFFAYAAPPPREEVKEATQAIKPSRSKPKPPAASMNRVIVAEAASSLSLPVPEVDPVEWTPDFGSGDDFSEGWGGGDGGAGGMGGGAGGGATFFNQSVKAKRFCYVIDFSRSMNGKRDPMMREELARSVGTLPEGSQFEMIFFAGPAWIAGSQVEMPETHREAIVRAGGKDYEWRRMGFGQGWVTKGREQKAAWRTCTAASREEAMTQIRETPLVWGTEWEHPLELALDLDPAPQVIFFMTDGAISGDMEDFVRRFGHRAKSKGTTINTVAMMEPQAEKPMKTLAERSGGQFTIIHRTGEIEVVPLK
ncbi:vWA domain-containing protein [Haloferula sargassicola]|uniref:VWFA domain-containing protein n=1 Tax=Haloferula sargassicola TaxID=490096 RepID=A0ABP9ULW5_9BACT